MRRNRCGLSAVLLAALIALGGCGTTSSDQINRLNSSGTGNDTVSGSEEEVTPLEQSNELPEDGVISQAQLATIAGKEGTYEFTGTDAESGISYTWSFDGQKIQNATAQKLKVSCSASLSEEEFSEVSALTEQAVTGLSLTLEDGKLAAPALLTLTLPEQWEVSSAVYGTLEDGTAERLSGVRVGTEDRNGTEVTTLTISVTELGGTFYVVGSTAEPDGTEPSETAGNTESDTHLCTISIDCSTVLDNMKNLKKSKREFVPSDGWILKETEVVYEPGESVYDILYRVCRDQKIQIDADYTPLYGAYYINGINQLYEFDCGSLSGWMFCVNDWYPNYGCSKYLVSDGDDIEFRYTCDLGRDVGESFYE